MKRNMDLVRHILMMTRDNDMPLEHSAFRLDDGGWSDEEVMYHIDMMNECGLLNATIQKAWGGIYYSATVYNLTWQGQDFCDSVADSKVWHKVKDVIKRGVGSASMDVTVTTITKIANQLIEKISLQ